MNKQELLADFMAGIERLADAMHSVPDDLLNYRPEIDDAWTIKEHVIHLIDTEINFFIRLKSIFGQPGSTCYVTDEEIWTKNIRRKNEDVKKYMSVFRLMREMAYDLLADEDENNWNRDYYIRPYPDRKQHVTIENWIQICIRHLHNHLEYIDRNKNEYKK